MFTSPGVPSCLALSTTERTNRTTKISNPDKHIVPEEGPKAFLPAKFSQLMSHLMQKNHSTNLDIYFHLFSYLPIKGYAM
jgi:hypothetical protein